MRYCYSNCILNFHHKVEGDDCNKENLSEGVCFFHLDPLLLWCRQCRQVLCAKCLSQQQHDGHTLHDMRTVLEEKKYHIEGETNQMLRYLKKEREQLTQELESVVSKLTKIYEKSEKLRLRINKVDGIRKVVGGTNDLREVAHLELLLHRAPKSTSFPDETLQTLLAHRGNNYSIGDEEIPINDKTETCTWDEDKSDIQMWPLTRDVAGGGRRWPIIKWQHFIAQVRTHVCTKECDARDEEGVVVVCYSGKLELCVLTCPSLPMTSRHRFRSVHCVVRI